MGRQFVAPTSAITQEAQALRGGLGSFAPFLQTAAATTGPTAYQQFLSPFQKDVIDTTLKEFDVQAAKGLPAIAAQAISQGAFGGGREGVARAEYQQQATGTEQHYKHNYYNRVLVKLNSCTTTIFKIN